MTPLLFIRREVFRISQSEMAAIAGVSQGTVSKWEARRLEPGRAEMEAIRAEAMGRGLPWQDAWFFSAGPEVPAPSAEQAA